MFHVLIPYCFVTNDLKTHLLKQQSVVVSVYLVGWLGSVRWSFCYIWCWLGPLTRLHSVRAPPKMACHSPGLLLMGLNHSILALYSGWTQEGKERTASSWGLGLELARCYFYHILLIKASHSPAQLKGRENRFQLYVDVAVCSYRDGAMVAVLLQASYAKEKGCSVSWLTKVPGNTWNAASEARVYPEGKHSCQRLLRRQLSQNMIYLGYHQ